MKRHQVVAALKKHWILTGLFLLLPLILLACHTPPTQIRVQNDTGGCSGGPCTLLVNGAIDTQGTGSEQGAHSYTATVPANTTTGFTVVGSGAWTFQTQSSCHNDTFHFNFEPNKQINVRFFCQAPAGAAQSEVAAQ
jgi:hypothetical protein